MSSKIPVSLSWCALFLGAQFLGAELVPSHWQFRKPLPVNAQTAVAEFTIDRSIYVRSKAGLEDLRVIHGAVEIPYVLEAQTGTHNRTERPSDVVNEEATASGDLELTVDASESGKRHNGVRVATTKRNFRQKVSVSTSDNGRAWTLVRENGWIVDFSEDGRRFSVLDIGYPESSRRYVRLRIRGWKDPRAITRCWLALEEDQPAVRDEMALLQAVPAQDSKTQSTLFSWDLGVAGVPHDALSLAVNTPEFQRAALVETSSDNQLWSALGEGVLSRFPREQSLTLTFPENHERYLRLRIFNQDDHPVAVEKAILSVTRRRIRFRPDGSGPYWLYYGNEDARNSAYDLAQLLARAPTAKVAAVQPGAEERNPAYQQKPLPVPPWSDRHKGVLYLTLAAAVVSMGVVTVRFLRRIGSENR